MFPTFLARVSVIGISFLFLQFVYVQGGRVDQGRSGLPHRLSTHEIEEIEGWGEGCCHAPPKRKTDDIRLVLERRTGIERPQRGGREGYSGPISQRTLGTYHLLADLLLRDRTEWIRKHWFEEKKNTTPTPKQKKRLKLLVIVPQHMQTARTGRCWCLCECDNAHTHEHWEPPTVDSRVFWCPTRSVGTRGRTEAERVTFC